MIQRYFSAWDKQTGRYMSTGLNSLTKEKLIEALTDYLNSDSTEDDLITASEENIEAAEFEIVEHALLINEEMD